MEIKTRLKFARVGAQKARLVADLVRGKDVSEALKILTFTNKKTAVMMKKMLKSAVAIAEEKKSIDIDNLYVKHVSVDAASFLKRYRPRAQGRAFPVHKKQSHINLVLDER